MRTSKQQTDQQVRRECAFCGDEYVIRHKMAHYKRVHPAVYAWVKDR